ncbi:acetolactate synthase large subunit [Accumulibacter sp.]|uniref:acetolactate synthase large subunit n=1 Tax=Accumulibacter sp. TaxID=2053492 RepID=UPI0025FD4389|nr:acetolactate synthase large subunit [Accumulibacter sp.]MCM8595582.1 acetolactate synthase large subunit [Accumulibacter sp.]MCM8624860.1 acetolactate synthase large subunit [Accumulibacter sp.]MDS4049730.1 acetolactate synthase large subunit [Accumulibacter sp.]
MNTGAFSLVHTAMRAGVEVCFANPGTTEMPIVLALDRAPGMRVVLGLFEGVCTGAADGWARMTGRPAATLLHLGPGFANGIANLHNARRARTPVVNWIGDHATRHLAFDAPLTSDISALTGSVGWTRTVKSADEMAEASLAAVEAALGPPGRVASLIIPADCQWEPGPEPLSATPSPALRETPGPALQEAARLLRKGRGGILLGGNALTVPGLHAAARVAAATACGVWIETFPSCQECGRHVPLFPALPYFPEQATEALANVASLVLAGAREPVAFFAYPNQPSRFLPDGAALCKLADPEVGVDAALALEALAQELDAPTGVMPPRTVPAFVPGGRPLTPDTLCRAMAAFTPENAIVVNEAATTGLTWNAEHASNAAPHTMLFLTGGAIGQGLPNALGAALACPDRRVIAFQADGSGLYTLQALWSMVRENADVTVVVCANRRYRILQTELARTGIAEPGPKAQALTDLTRPVIDWPALAKGFGVPSCSVHTDGEFADALLRAFAERGPSLIEAVLA